MKRFYLSTPAERAKGIFFSIVMSIVMIALLVALRDNLTILIMTVVGVALVIGILVLYILNVSKAACIPDPENRTLRVTGFRERVIDLSRAACLETITVKSGHVESRSLAFTDAEGGVVAIVPTYFTSKRGVLAEPMAMELAQVLNLEFNANVPAWEYDEEARKAHEIEVAQQEKAEAAARKEAKKALRVAKIRKQMEEIRNEKKS
ncbi:MAG: hypothetical protein II364_01935 [Bacteroidales bacterium]|nr:hypothetical protein [Bacteroidales bacterium]